MIKRSVRSVPRRRWHARLPVLARLGREQQTPTVPRRYDAHAARHGSPLKAPRTAGSSLPAAGFTPNSTRNAAFGSRPRRACSSIRGAGGARGPGPGPQAHRRSHCVPIWSSPLCSLLPRHSGRVSRPTGAAGGACVPCTGTGSSTHRVINFMSLKGPDSAIRYH